MSNRGYGRRSNQNYRDANNPQDVNAGNNQPQQQQQPQQQYQQQQAMYVQQQPQAYNQIAPGQVVYNVASQQQQPFVYTPQPQYQYNPQAGGRGGNQQPNYNQQQRGGRGGGRGAGRGSGQPQESGGGFPRPGVPAGGGRGQGTNNQLKQSNGNAVFVPGQGFSAAQSNSTGNAGFAIPQPTSQQRPQNNGQWNQPLNHQQPSETNNGGRGGYGRGGGNLLRGGSGGGGSRACFKCGQEGHMSRDCPQQGAGRGRGGGSGGGGSRACFKCGEEGHMSLDCPQQAAGGGRGGGGEGRGGSGGGVGDRSGAEFKTKFDRIIRAFVENDDLNDITLPSTLTAKERHDVHKLAMHYRLDHASSGPKDARTLKLTKPTGIRATECQTSGDALVKTMDGYQGLQPLHDEHLEDVDSSVKESIHELHANMVFALEHIDDNSLLARKPRQFAEDRPFRGAPPSQDQFKMSRGDHAALVDFRTTLPSYKSRHEIVDAVRKNDVIIVSGDTGCGKTTQIPQILDDAGIFPKNTCMICTQPRRISALSVAERVAQERGEPCGASVGYVIRFENVTSSATRIAFVTTGILLRRMHADPTLAGINCVIVDEVHERDLDTDFALLLLRDIIRGPNPNKLKLVIMSATIQIDRLVDYFSFKGKRAPPLVSIPGTLFPVSVYYLEHALHWLKLPNEAASAMNLLEISTTADPNGNVAGGAGGATQSSSSSVPVFNNAEEFKKLEEAAVNQLTREEEVSVPYDVVVGLIEMFHTMTRSAMDQSILVFLPGWGQIDRVATMLKRSRHAKELSVHMLHSSIPSSQQARVFNPAPRNFRKVVLSTNIAETSITINDVVFVIDSCVLKGSAYDAAGNTSTLASQMIAKANGKQRRGRAGRVRSGVCVHLLPQMVYESLPDFLPAEIMRSSLEEVCLQVKSLRKDELCVDVLERALDTPPLTSVTHAVKLLKDLSAFDSKENITNLGKALAGLPLHPLLGKMLLVASLLGVLKPIATIAGALGGKSPFTRPLPSQRFEADEMKRSLSGIHASDHIALLTLYKEWEASPYGFQYAREHFADHAVLKGMQRSTKQLTRLVCQSGFLRKLSKAINDGSKGRNKGSGDAHMQEIAEMFASRHENNYGLVRFALLWSLYPRIGCAERRKANPDLFCWDNKSCAIHNSSVMFKSKKGAYEGREFFVYFDRMRLESNLNIMDVTLVPRVMALLCAKEVSLHPLADIPEAFYKDAGSKYDAMEPIEPAVFEKKEDVSVLRMDGGKKLFYLPNRPAELIRDLREVMEFYFSLSIKEVDASIFPEALVRALGEVIHYPVQHVDVARLVEDHRKRDEEIRKRIALGGPDAADLEELLAGGGTGVKSGVAVNWEGLDDDEEDELGVPVIVEDTAHEILTGNLSEAKANRIISLYGDLAILHRAKVTFTAATGALGINNGVSEPLPVEATESAAAETSIEDPATGAQTPNNDADDEYEAGLSDVTTQVTSPTTAIAEPQEEAAVATSVPVPSENPMASLDPYYIEEDTNVAWN